ncbi:hypothetical protein F5Y11DRAFT_346309 [Daldinia sp. FL1419]|nr:hypothetical protein F5Y11DRAFT_346309 [Daldinia sp. FL1419]
MEPRGNQPFNKMDIDQGSPFNTGFKELLNETTQTAGPASTSYGGLDPSVAPEGPPEDVVGNDPEGLQAVLGALSLDREIKRESQSPSRMAMTYASMSQNVASAPPANIASQGGPIAPLNQQAVPAGTSNMRASFELPLQQLDPGALFPLRIGYTAPLRRPFGSLRDRDGTQGDFGPGHASSSSFVDGKHVTSPMILSQECQKRRFNPHFTEWRDHNGFFRCSVTIRGRMIVDGSAYGSATEAKAAVSEMALPEVRKIPCEDPADKPSAVLTEVSERGIRGGIANVHQQARTSSSLRDNRIGRHQPRGNRPNWRHNNTDVEEQEDIIMAQIQSMFGVIDGPSREVANDPLASRAFLQGMALGAQLGRSSERRLETYARHPTPTPQPRGLRSRQYGVNDRRRERSPNTGSQPRYSRARSPIHHRNH